MEGINPTNVMAIQQPIKTSKKREAAALVTGAAVGALPNAYVVYDAFKPLKEKDITAMQNMIRIMTPNVETIENTKNIATQIIKDTGLEAKGVKLLVADNTPASNKLLDEALSKEKPKKIVAKFKQFFQNGCNAAYVPSTKNVIVNDKIAYESVYHEIGHAMNANGNILTKALQKGRALTPFGASIVAPIALGVAMFHKVDKTKPKEQKGKMERALDFVANNAGKLTMASYLPMLSEEGLASIRGIKVAKKYLNPEHIKKLKGSYTKAWGTYAFAAVVVAGTVGLANLLMDGIRTKQDKKKHAALKTFAMS